MPDTVPDKEREILIKILEHKDWSEVLSKGFNEATIVLRELLKQQLSQKFSETTTKLPVDILTHKDYEAIRDEYKIKSRTFIDLDMQALVKLLQDPGLLLLLGNKSATTSVQKIEDLDNKLNEVRYIRNKRSHIANTSAITEDDCSMLETNVLSIEKDDLSPEYQTGLNEEKFREMRKRAIDEMFAQKVLHKLQEQNKDVNDKFTKILSMFTSLNPDNNSGSSNEDIMPETVLPATKNLPDTLFEILEHKDWSEVLSKGLNEATIVLRELLKQQLMQKSIKLIDIISSKDFKHIRDKYEIDGKSFTDLDVQALVKLLQDSDLKLLDPGTAATKVRKIEQLRDRLQKITDARNAKCHMPDAPAITEDDCSELEKTVLDIERDALSSMFQTGLNKAIFLEMRKRTIDEMLAQDVLDKFTEQNKDVNDKFTKILSMFTSLNTKNNSGSSNDVTEQAASSSKSKDGITGPSTEMPTDDVSPV